MQEICLGFRPLSLPFHVVADLVRMTELCLQSLSDPRLIHFLLLGFLLSFQIESLPFAMLLFKRVMHVVAILDLDIIEMKIDLKRQR